MTVSKQSDPKARLNYFLQNWEVSTRRKAGLPQDLRRMVVAARKYGARCDVRVAAKDLKEAMPVWYHIGMEPGRSTAKTVAARCLRENHGVVTVAQCARVMLRLRVENEEHVPVRSCPCAECEEDRRSSGCADPHRCACAAERLMEKLQPKWKPDQTYHADGLTLTPARRTLNETARAEKGRVLFDLSITQTAPLAAVFRVFTQPAASAETTAARPPRPFGINEEEVEVYTDGSCIGNGTVTAVAGSGVWFGAGDLRNEGARVPYDAQSNQTAEIYALILAERRVPPFAPLHFVSDSKYVVDGLTMHLRKWEEKGWIGVANTAVFRDAVAALRARSAATTLRRVKGHSRVTGNEAADALAKEGALKPPPFRPIHLPQRKYVRDGAALEKMTQSLAYKGVKMWKGRSQRAPAARNLVRIVDAVEGACGVSMLPRTVWLSLRKDPVSRKMRDFLWKAIHGAHRVGKYWGHIPGYEERKMCAQCNQVDDMEHILTACEAPGQKQVWLLVKELLKDKVPSVPDITYGLALGSHIFTVLDREGAVVADQTRMVRIVLMEATHLIWALRCERVIGWEASPDKRHSLPEIRRRFEAKLNHRLSLDQGGTNVRIHKKKTLSSAKVRGTWRGMLRDEQTLPEDWTNQTGVLVGMPPYPDMRDAG